MRRIFAAILSLLQAVRTASWHPREELLAVCSGSPKLFLWSPNGCRTVPMPSETNFRVSSVVWSPGDETLLLLDRDRFCLCFLDGGERVGA